MADTITRPSAPDVLRRAAQAIREHEELRKALRASEARLRDLSREYDAAANVWGTHPDHLARSARLQGYLE